jgi:hypothetical protein
MRWFEERVLPPFPSERASVGASVRVISTKHSEDSRLYELELVDTEYPNDRFTFEVQIENSGETELRER